MVLNTTVLNTAAAITMDQRLDKPVSAMEIKQCTCNLTFNELFNVYLTHVYILSIHRGNSTAPVHGPLSMPIFTLTALIAAMITKSIDTQMIN